MPAEYGGAPLLGLKGLVVKTHGSSKAKEVTNSIDQCVILYVKQNINAKYQRKSECVRPKINKEDIKKGSELCMEFEKLKKIIAEVLNVDEDEITMDTTFIDDLGADSSGCDSRLLWESRRNCDIEIPRNEHGSKRSVNRWRCGTNQINDTMDVKLKHGT